MKTISIVVSIYNEAESIPALVTELKKLINNHLDLNFEILFVNDGSKDNSFAILYDYVKHESRFKIVNLSRNFGHEAAMTAGADHAIGDAVVFMDGDLQHPPLMVSEMIQKWQSGYQVVLTHRKKNEDESFIKRQISFLYYKVLNFLSDVKINSHYPDFRLVDRIHIARIKQIRERDRMFRALLELVGISNAYVIEFEAPSRQYGVSKYNLIKHFALGMDAILSFSIKPLRAVTLLGAVASFFSITYGLYVFVDHVFFSRPQTGFATIVILLVVLCSVQIVIMGLIGEYIGRMYMEVKRRPLYFADVITHEDAKK